MKRVSLIVSSESFCSLTRTVKLIVPNRDFCHSASAA